MSNVANAYFDYQNARATNQVFVYILLAVFITILFVFALGNSLYECPRQIADSTDVFCRESGIMRGLLFSYLLLVAIMHLSAWWKLSKFNEKLTKQTMSEQDIKEYNDAKDFQKKAHYVSIPLYIAIIVGALAIGVMAGGR